MLSDVVAPYLEEEDGAKTRRKRDHYISSFELYHLFKKNGQCSVLGWWSSISGIVGGGIILYGVIGKD